MKRFRFISSFAFIFILLFDAHLSKAQKEKDLEGDFQEIIESLSEDLERSDFDYQDLLENLESFYDHPLDLNKATLEDLSDLFLLSDIQIAALLKHTEQFGPLITIFELQAVSGIDLQTIHRILPFITVRKELEDFHVPFKELFTKGKFQLFVRFQKVLEEQIGYTDPDTTFIEEENPDGELIPVDTILSNRYLGSSYKLYTRVRYDYGSKLSYGLTAEKDAGEAFFRGTQKQGFDFYSGHFFIRDIGPFKAIAAGDYEVKLGQGLILWSGFGFRKGPEVMKIKKGGRTLRPYTSVNENRFFRGFGATAGFGNLESTVFVSRNKVDGNITSEEDEFNDVIAEVSSFQESGFHRTNAEVEDKDAFNLFTTGASVRYKKRTWQLGANLVYTSLDVDFNRNLQLYNQFEFSDNRLLNASLDYSFLLRNFHFFGELAMSDNGGIGFLNGVMASIDPGVDLAILHRRFDRDFQTQYGNAFAEATSPSNENGTYFGLSTKPIRHIKIEGYFDVFRYRWLRFLVDAPSNGYDYLVQLTYKPSKKTELYVRWKSETKSINAPDNETKLDFLTDRKLSRFRFHASHKISRDWTLRSRAEYSFFNNQIELTETGFLIYHDVIFKPIEFPLSVWTRFALFDTKSNDSKIYAYENDLLYTFSIPAFIGKGSRFYIMLKFKPFRNTDVWLKFSQTWYAGAASIPGKQEQEVPTVLSGLNEIQGDHVSEIKAQLRLKF